MTTIHIATLGRNLTAGESKIKFLWETQNRVSSKYSTTFNTYTTTHILSKINITNFKSHNVLRTSEYSVHGIANSNSLIFGKFPLKRSKLNFQHFLGHLQKKAENAVKALYLSNHPFPARSEVRKTPKVGIHHPTKRSVRNQIFQDGGQKLRNDLPHHPPQSTFGHFFLETSFFDLDHLKSYVEQECHVFRPSKYRGFPLSC